MKIYFLYPEKLKKNEKRPAIVFFFGGAWVGGSVQQFRMQGRALAEKGMVAVLADYRVKNRHKNKPDGCVEDAKSIIRFLRANARQYHIDPDRIVASGGSAGGHLAAATAFLDGFNSPADDFSVSPRPNALVLFNPAINVAPLPIGNGYEHCKDFFPEISPVHNIKDFAVPTLVMSGTKDNYTPLETLEDFCGKIRALGVRCDLDLYEGAGHGFFNYRKTPRSEKFYRQTLDSTIDFLKSIGYIKKNK